MMVCVPSFLSWRVPNLVIEETVDADLEAAGHREPLTLALPVAGQPGQAVALLERLHAAAAAQNRAGSVIETQALRALALAASGEEAGAVDVLAGVLTLACPQGYARVFADEGPPVGALLGRLAAAQKTVRAAAPRPPPGAAARPDSLTGRPRPGRHCRAISRQGTFHR